MQPNPNSCFYNFILFFYFFFILGNIYLILLKRHLILGSRVSKIPLVMDNLIHTSLDVVE